jgi:hypothetical protein
LSKAALLKALQAEGVRASAAPYPEQVSRASIRLPLFQDPAGELIEQYAKAFEKVWAPREKLEA